MVNFVEGEDDTETKSSISTWNADLPENVIVRLNSDASFLRSSGSSSPGRPRQSPGRHLIPEAYAVPYVQCTWDFFLSHKQSNAQDAVSNLRVAISERMPSCSFWLDIEQDPTVNGMCHGVSNSKNFLLFLTTGVTESKFCQMEMRWAIEADKNIILVAETDERHGKPDYAELIAKCPEDLKELFEDHVIIPWYRVFEIDGERSSVGAKLQRPLMFRYDDTSSVASDETSIQVIDSSFVFFTSIWGIALPGASTFVQRWAISVTFLVLACGALCFSRFFHQTGPTWLDSWTLLQNVTAHPVVFILLQVVLSVLRSDLILDLLEHHIDCKKSEAVRLRFRTRILCALVWILTFLVSAATWWGYIPGFLHPGYIGALGNELPDHRFFFAIAHTFAYAFVLPIMYGSGLSSVMMMLLIQELCFMAFTTNLQRLNDDIKTLGLNEAVANTSALRVEEGDLAKFKIGFVKTWRLQKQIQRKIAIPYMLFWVLQLCALPWSLISLAKGFEADFADPRVERLHQYDHLLVRLLSSMIASPWFGVPTWIFALYPWLPLYHHWRFHNLTKQLLFAKPQVEVAFRSFLSGFELYFSGYAIHATPAMLLVYFPFLLINTLGNVAEKVRLLRAY